MILNYEVPYISNDGYGYMVERFMVGLAELGVELIMRNIAIKYCNTSYIDQDAVKMISDARRYKRRESGDATLIIGQPNNPWIGNNNKTAGLTMWETDTIPTYPFWADNVNKADLLIVPGSFNEEVFRRCGVDIPIDIVPLGVETDYCKYSEKDDDTFVFGFMASNAMMDVRKNYLAVKNAYDAVRRDDTELWIKTKYGFMRSDLPNYDDAVIIEGEAPKVWMFEEFYDKIHCFIFPTKGEGFGLPPLEAMARGCISILTGKTGGDYPNADVCYILDSKSVPLSENGHWMYIPNVGSDSIGNWREPDVEQLKEYMDAVYLDWKNNSFKKGEAMGRMAVEYVRTKYNFDISSRMLLESLTRMVGG